MGIFDLFKKKKKVESTFPENELEQSLMDAASKVSARKEFYRKLMWNDLYVWTAEDSISTKGHNTLEEGTTIKMVSFENGYIPIFTSINRFFDKGIVKKSVPYFSLRGQDLFELAKGATFVLNPYSEYSKEITPAEIKDLMDGSIFDTINPTDLEDYQLDEFNAYYAQAGKEQEGLIFLEGYKSRELNPIDRGKLENSIESFQKCLEIVPDHWQSMLFIGKAYQRLGKHEEAFAQLEKAFQVEKQNHSIAMEASLEAMHLENIDKALYYSEESLKRKPNDPILMGNHAMNLLIGNRDEEAVEVIEQAMQLDPNDTVNQNIKSIIQGVISGNRNRPSFKDAIG